MFRLDSIKSRILAFAIAATLIPALTTAWLSYRQNRRALSEKLTEEVSAASSQAAREMDLWLKERLYDVRVFASSYEVTENLEARGAQSGRALVRLTEYLGSVQERFDDYASLVVARPGGQVAAWSGTDPDSTALAAPVMDEVRTGESVMGQPFVDPTGETAIRLAVPVSDASGRVLGAMSATLRFHAVEALLRQFVPGEAGELYLVTGDGALLASSRGHDAAPLATRLAPDVLSVLRARTSPTVQYTNDRGDVVVGRLGAIPRTEWAVIAEIPRDEAFREIARLRNTTILTLLGLLALVGGLGYALGNIIVRPLDRLTSAAAQVAGGDYEVDLPVTGGGEVAMLTRVFNDMVARVRESRQSLEHRSVTDGLTGLFNRRHLMEILEQEIRRSQRHNHAFAVLMLDVDHFKKYNDTYGHLAGDDVLERLARIFLKAVREVDVVGRYGGEEFAIIMPETPLDAAADAGNRIRAQVADEPFGDEARPVTVTLSIGVAEFPADGDAADAIVGAADAALYQAKRRGRDRVVKASRRKTKTKKTKKTKED